MGEKTELVGRCKETSFSRDGLREATLAGVPSKQFIGAVMGRGSSMEGTLESLRRAEFESRRECLADDVVEGRRDPCDDRGMVKEAPTSSWLCILSCSSFENCWRCTLSGSER